MQVEFTLYLSGENLTGIEMCFGYTKAPIRVLLEHPILAYFRHYFTSFSESWGGKEQSKEKSPLIIKEFLPENVEQVAVLTETHALIKQVKEGLEFYPPELVEEGVNGTYLMKNSHEMPLAIFKPDDEEGKNSPKASRNEPDNEETVDKGIFSGEASSREVAAYLLDREGFYGVPPTFPSDFPAEYFGTTSTESPSTKSGSLQQYVEHDGAAGDIGPKAFPANEVHKIGILDIQIMNCDRHEGNILYKKNANGSFKLIPIDHSYSLPHSLDKAWFDWIHWPQAKQPFCDETKQHIASIDIDSDCKVLQEIGITPDSLRNFRISSTWLKKGAAAGLTLYEIATLVCRLNPLEPCKLEQMYKEAQIKSGQDEQLLESTLFRMLDQEISEKKASHPTL